MTIRSRILLFAGLWLMGTAQLAAAAITLSLSPPFASFSIGDTFDVDLLISGLNAGAPPAVGAFDLNIAYDPGLLSADSVIFGTSLGDPDLEALSASDLATPGNANVAEVSLLDTATLVSAQLASFKLATISFTALADGTGGFSLVGDLRVDDPLGNKLLVVVPEPGSAALFAAGLLLTLGGRVFSRRGMRRFWRIR